MNVNRPNGNLALPGLAKHKPTTDDEVRENSRLRVLKVFPDTLRKHVVAFIGEVAGTFMFLFFAFAATQIANSQPAAENGDASSDVARLLYISLAFGMSLLVNVWVFFRITGGVFNPAVTFGLCMIGALPWIRGAVIFIAQILGAMAASAVVGGLFPGPMPVYTTLGSGTSIARGVFIEMFLTAELVFTIFMLAVEKSKATYLAPVAIGLSLFLCELAGVAFTGGSLNPARSFGPAAIYGSFPGYHWIYWVGPLLGALVAVLFHRLIKGLEYETVNPTQDLDDKENEIFRSDEDPRPKNSRARAMNNKRLGAMSAESEA